MDFSYKNISFVLQFGRDLTSVLKRPSSEWQQGTLFSLYIVDSRHKKALSVWPERRNKRWTGGSQEKKSNIWKRNEKVFAWSSEIGTPARGGHFWKWLQPSVNPFMCNCQVHLRKFLGWWWGECWQIITIIHHPDDWIGSQQNRQIVNDVLTHSQTSSLLQIVRNDDDEVTLEAQCTVGRKQNCQNCSKTCEKNQAKVHQKRLENIWLLFWKYPTVLIVRETNLLLQILNWWLSRCANPE